MARSKVQKSEALAISQRLRDFAKRRYGTWEAFYKKVGISRTTAAAWIGRHPSVPDPVALLRLAGKANMNLNWLLLGQGHDLFEFPATSPEEVIENRIEAELRQSESAKYEEFNGAWERMRYRADFSQAEPKGLVIQLAVEGVRPRFQENLRLVRHYAGVAAALNMFPHMRASSGPEGEEQAEQFKKLLREALETDPSDLQSPPEPKPKRG